MAGKQGTKRNQETLETALSKLDEVVKSLSQEQVSLEDSFDLYKQGMELVKTCTDRIDAVEKKMLILDGKVDVDESDD